MTLVSDKEETVLLIGAGPAGLTAGVELIRAGRKVIIVEATNQVGGISRTEVRDEWRFDLGGHRFFTKIKRVEDFWFSILSRDEFLRRDRQSRIFFKGKFFDYPLKPLNALRNLGVIGTIRAIFSFLWVQMKPMKKPLNFETWVASRFGWYLYRTFFKTYTEKVWGIPANQIQADWAAQRIKNLSLSSAILSAFFPQRFNGGQITTLIDQFHYPKYGPGMMWERCAELIESSGSEIAFECSIRKIELLHQSNSRFNFKVTLSDSNVIECSYIVSTMALRDLLPLMHPMPPIETLGAAQQLRYRSFVTVAFPISGTSIFPDNWIYIHSPEVKVGRIQNFGTWSPYMVKDGHSCIGLEYFVDEGDEFWNMSDDDLIDFARKELVFLNLAQEEDIESGFVVKVPKAYPVYDEAYGMNVQILREHLAKMAPYFQTVGRNGLHRYNNQDHSMLTAMFAVDNILFGTNKDVWSVNTESEYLESSQIPTERLTPVYPKKK